MPLALSCDPDAKQWAIPLHSDHIGSCLPRTERRLARSARSALLAALADRAEELEFRSVMDALLAALLPDFAAPIRRFYEDRGPRMVEYLSPSTVRRIDETLAGSVDLASRACAVAAREAGADPRRALDWALSEILGGPLRQHE